MDDISFGKNRILDGAIEVLRENPIEKATVRKIAQKAGLTTGAIYHHYKNKDELLFDVITRSLHFTKELTDNLDLNIGETREDLLEKIRYNLRNRLSKKEEQRLYLILLNDAIAKDTPIREKYCANYKENISNVERLLKEVSGHDFGARSEAMASILIALADGIAIQQALNVLPDAAVIDLLLDFVESCVPDFLEKTERGRG